VLWDDRLVSVLECQLNDGSLTLFEGLMHVERRHFILSHSSHLFLLVRPLHSSWPTASYRNPYFHLRLAEFVSSSADESHAYNNNKKKKRNI
jgi:hypothetical protein